MYTVQNYFKPEFLFSLKRIYFMSDMTLGETYTSIRFFYAVVSDGFAVQ